MKRSNRQLARKIVNRLFTNGAGETATRLVLMDERGAKPRDLGGWSVGAALDQIEAILKVEVRA